MKTDWKKLFICLGIPLGVGGLAALLTARGMSEYSGFIKPPLSPPGWVFPVVWTVLYLLMGWASYRILTCDGPQTQKARALQVYGAQLAVNFLWPLIFFGLSWYLAALFVLIGLWILVFWTMRLFMMLDAPAGNVLLPYLLWLSFAGYLNAGVFLLN